MGTARSFMAAIGISLFIAAGFPVRQTTAQQATASTAETLASVSSILVGIAIDKGLLRLDQKLPQLVVEATERTIDPRAADITLRDLLMMSSGFDPHEMIELPGVWNAEEGEGKQCAEYRALENHRQKSSMSLAQA